MFNPPHPGGILKDALDEIPTTQTEFAAHLGISRITLARITSERAGISATMSIKLGQAFGQSPDLWFKMQNTYDFWIASREKRAKVRPIRKVA